MNRRSLTTRLGATAAAAVLLTQTGRHGAALQWLAGPAEAEPASAPQASEPWADRLVAAAARQIGVTVTYDPAYVALTYPGGDIARDRGVCTDVIVRAYRDGLATDLQRLVHEDMAASFSAYPAKWGLKRPDSHIDHRRVPNLQTFFTRRGAALPVTQRAADYEPGDMVTMMVSATLPHIAIVSSRSSTDAARPLIVHNIGAGTREEDRLFEFPLTGHYRFKPDGI